MMEKFNLKWNDFQANLTNSFSTLRKEKDFYDVSLVGDDDLIVDAHKVVLSASSEFFKNILRKVDHYKPMVYLSGVESKELNHILDYIYEGEVQIFQEDLDNFLDVAKKLKISGLNEEGKEEMNDMHEKNYQADFDTEIEETSFLTDTKVHRKMECKEKKTEKTVSVLANQGTDVYEEAKRAVDEILVKDFDNWVCNVCNKSSKKNSDMRKHAELHIEGLSFPCQLCADTFRSRKSLSKHYNKHKNVLS